MDCKKIDNCRFGELVQDCADNKDDQCIGKENRIETMPGGNEKSPIYTCYAVRR